MSYCRFAANSDIYLFRSTIGGIDCWRRIVIKTLENERDNGYSLESFYATKKR